MSADGEIVGRFWRQASTPPEMGGGGGGGGGHGSHSLRRIGQMDGATAAVRGGERAESSGGGRQGEQTAGQTAPSLTTRERRFLRFASLEYRGEVYMSPRDLLDSLTEERPRTRARRRVLTEEDARRLLRKTPSFRSGTAHLFRKMDADGFISFTEYLFLLSVLTKPQNGFRIAFNMFDMDGNERVDKKEFLVIRSLISLLRRDGKIARLDDVKDRPPDADMATVSNTSTLQLAAQRVLALLASIVNRTKDVDEAPVGAEDAPDTTLLVHFFGPKGTGVLSFDDFKKFTNNLQTEVIEMEFNEFSKGKSTISETNFAKVLLRYTVVQQDEYDKYLERVVERTTEDQGISLSEFRNFCHFLNNLEDFAVAIKLYSFADLPVSQAEFARAVKVSTGCSLPDHLINTIYKIFDVNNDGELSYSEFIAVMKDRIHRGFRSHLNPKAATGWQPFRMCVRDEMRKY